MLMSYPVARWLFAYQRKWLRGDVVAGLTASAVVLPKAMAYALIAGLPVEAGLYTAMAAMLVYPFLGSSRPLSVTTTSALAMLTAAQVVAILSDAGGVDARAVVATLAFLVGGILVMARIFRLGFVANFISLPVLVGFEAGVGIAILVGQLKSVLGVHVTSKTTVGTLLELPALVPHAHGLTILVASIGIGVLYALPRFFPRVSAPLAWVGISIAASAAFGLSQRGVQTVGSVPAGLPAITLPDFQLVAQLWPAALAVALMSFTESVAAARAFWQRDDTPVNANQELLAVGGANFASALLGGLPAGGGTSQTAVADKAGARSQMAQWVGAATVIVVLLYLSRAIGLLPQAALGALIVVVSASMVKPEAFRAIARVRNTELIWALAAMAGVVLIGTLEGILIAVALSVLMLLYEANHPPVYAVAYNSDEAVFRRAGENDRDETFPGLLILRTEGRLHFANADNAAEKMNALISQAQPQVIVLECSAIPDIEYSALTMLIDAEKNQRERGVALWLAAVNPDMLKVIERSPLGTTMAQGRIFKNLHKALEAWQSADKRIAQAAA